MSINHLLKKKVYTYLYINLYMLLVKLILFTNLFKRINNKIKDILNINGKFLIKGCKNSDSKINKFFVEINSIELSQESEPKPTKKSLAKKPKKILFKLNKNKGNPIKNSESFIFL